MVNVKNKPYQHLLRLFEDKVDQNMKKLQPKLEFIKPFEVEQVNCAITTSLQTWLEVGYYWQVMIDEEQMCIKYCFIYLYCVQVTC